MGGTSRPKCWTMSAVLDDLELVTQPFCAWTWCSESSFQSLGFRPCQETSCTVEMGSD